MSDVVELDRVGRMFRSDEGLITALAEVALSISAATFVAVMGATGSGKSTLLAISAPWSQVNERRSCSGSEPIV